MDQDMLIHPGEILKEEFLEPYGLNANQLAIRLDVPPNAITGIINGTRGVSGRMSKLLGHAFGMSEEFFANLQTRYELDLAAIEASKDEKAAARLRRADALAKELGVT
jgi:antitoxin HigA-1